MPNTLSKNWINMFDAIFYINMTKSIDRRQHIESEFSHFTGELIRINATTPETLGDKNIIDIIENNKNADEPYRIKGHTLQNQNEISLGLSHADAINAAIDFFKKTSKSNILIIEDDAIITPLDTSQTNKLEYQPPNGYDIWQLGYTIFTKNAGSWLTEREYAIKCKKLKYGFATAEKGIFGTLGYAINLREDNIHKFERFSNELSKGSISDYCLSEQKYLNKVIYEQKLLLPLTDSSTISTDSTYSIVEAGYLLNAFDEGFVKNTDNYDQSLITCYRDTYENRLAYLILEQNNIEDITIFTRKFFDESLEDIIFDAKELYDTEIARLDDNVIKRAFIVIFDNLSKPNFGKRFYIKK